VFLDLKNRPKHILWGWRLGLDGARKPIRAAGGAQHLT